MSKLHKSNRRSMRPKLSMKPMMSMKKPKATNVSPDMAPGSDGTGSSGIGKAAGILGLVGSAVGIAQGIKGLKGKRQKPKVDKEKLKAVGRVQKPALSKKKVKGYDGKSKYTKKEVDSMSSLDRNRYLKGSNRGGRPGDYKGIKVPRVGKPKLTAKKTVARKKKAIARKEQMISNAKQMAKDGLVSKKRVNKDIKRKKKAISRKKAIIEKVSKPKRKGILGKYRKPKLLKTRPGEKGLNIGVGAGLGKLAVLGAAGLGIAKLLKK